MKRWTSAILAVTAAVALQGTVEVSLADTAAPASHSARPCPSGSPHCVEQTLTAMRLRLARLVAGCDHRAVFALVYLRTTERFRDSAATPRYFDDAGWVNAEDALFASYYFTASDAWAAGDHDRIPPAWRVAFEAAGSKATSGAGDLLLGMNAHVTRDLPFVLEASGVVAPDGTSRKGDHDRVNDMLATLPGPVLAEAADRFDPGLTGTPTAGPDTSQAALRTLLSWRETAWQDAVALVQAPDRGTHERIARDIELRADTRARTMRDAFAKAPATAVEANRSVGRRGKNCA